MRATGAERDVIVGIAPDVDRVGTVEGALVAVGRRVDHQHVVARGDRLTAHLGVLGRHPGERHHRSRVAQQLLDRDRQQLGVVAQCSELLGALEQRERAGGDEVAGRLRSRVLQQHEEHRELHLREPFAVDLGVEQHAHQVVARFVGPLGAHRVGVDEHRLRRLGPFVRRGVGVEAEGELGPLEDLLAILLGHADEVGDRVQREPQRDVAHEVALAALGDRIDHRVDPRLHVRGEVVDATGREPRADELAQLRVLGRIEADHEQRRTRLVAEVGAVGEERVRRVPEAVPVARDALHVGVTAHGPVAVLPARMVVVRDRVGLAQLPEHLVREPLRIGRGVVQGRTVVGTDAHAHAPRSRCLAPGRSAPAASRAGIPGSRPLRSGSPWIQP